MEDISIEKLGIPKLTGRANYWPWSVQVRKTLIGQDLWDVVELGVYTPNEGKSKPEDAASAEAQAPEGKEVAPVHIERRTVQKCARASSIIMKLCTQTVVKDILLKETAKEQWDTFKKMYGSTSLQELGVKQEAFTSYRPEKGAKVSEVATRLDTLQYEIMAIDPNETPSERLKISVLFQAIRALDARYEPLILQLKISGQVADYATLIEHFLDAERQYSLVDSAKETGLRANSDLKGQKRKFKGKCFYCKKEGHRQVDCKTRQNDEKSGEKSAEKSGKGGPSTGPLATPSGGKGLSPPPDQAKVASEVCWTADINEGHQRLVWVVDSGCSRHMTFSRDAFIDYNHLDKPVSVETASGASIQGIGEGSVVLDIVLEGQNRQVLLTNVLHVPRIAGSLISVSQLEDRGLTVRTRAGPKRGILIELKGKVVALASRIGKSYILNCTDQGETALAVAASADDSEIWHRRFGHFSGQTIRGVEKVTTGHASPIQEIKKDCQTCDLTKTVRVINRVAPERSSGPLDRVYTDIWGPYKVATADRARYFISFTDDYSRKSWIYPVKERSELHSVFRQFKVHRELESTRKIKVVRCDNGKEYVGLGNDMDAHGIQFEYTTVYTPEQNGVAERLNRTLVQLARAMLLDAGLPTWMWGYALEAACHIRNRMPIGPKGLTPEEAYSGKRPHIGHLKVFGCLAYAHIPKETRGKLENTSLATCLVGYMETSRQYKLYEPIGRRIIVSTAPIFRENERLDFRWNDNEAGDLVVPFDPMLPEWDNDIPEERGVPEAVTDQSSDGIRGSPNLISTTPTSWSLWSLRGG